MSTYLNEYVSINPIESVLKLTPFHITIDALHIALFTIILVLITPVIINAVKSTLNRNKQIPPSQMVDFLLTVGKLKAEKRTGWVNNQIKLPESISDHQYRMAMMGYFIRDPSRNPQTTASIALVHDIAEAIVGDITPPESSGVSVLDKHRMEDEALKTIASQLGGSNGDSKLAAELEDLYMQYNAQRTVEGRFCKQLDKLEMLIQAYEYETSTENAGKDLSGFYHSANKGIHDPYLREIQAEVLRRRIKEIGPLK